MSLLIVGCGYVGRAFAQEYLAGQSDHSTAEPVPLYALTRSSQSAGELELLGVQPIIGQWLDYQSLPSPPENIDAVLVAVPHRADEHSQLPADSDQHHVCGLQNLSDWLLHGRSSDLPQSKNPKLIYLSTTGVYGTTAPGERVDEDSPIQPTRIGPRIAAAAEQWLQAQQHRWRSTTLRLAGIYGPGRVPLLQSIREGKPLELPQAGMLNLIHVADIVQAITWLLQAWPCEPLYALSDGSPTVRRQFYLYLASLLGLSEPQFTEAASDSLRVKRVSDKVVDPARFWLQSTLRPRYPDFKAGLKQILEIQCRSGASDELGS